MKKVAALIAVHNRLAFTRRCIECLRAASHGVQLTIVVVDDGSVDGTAEWLRGNMRDDITVLNGSGDLWFGGAMQLGINWILGNRADIEYLLLLNNDTFLRVGMIEVLVNACSPRTVLGASYFVSDRNEVRSSAYRWQLLSGLVGLERFQDWSEHVHAESKCLLVADAVSTTVCVYPASVLQTSRRVDLALHPHHRYDMLLAAYAKRTGAKMLALPTVVADHLYERSGGEFTCRKMAPRELLRAARDPKSVICLRGGLMAQWESAPSRCSALVAVGKRLATFGYQVVRSWVLFSSKFVKE